MLIRIRILFKNKKGYQKSAGKNDFFLIKNFINFYEFLYFSDENLYKNYGDSGSDLLIRIRENELYDLPDEALKEDGGVVVGLEAEPVLSRHYHTLLQQLPHSLGKE